MQHLLIEFQKHRMDWAFEAKDDFLNQFRIFKATENKQEDRKLIISVYGPTQVGKTSLILTLMGVKEQYLDEISEFLRGKRKLGESATATVTKYQISPTEDFIVKVPDHQERIIKSVHEFEEQMAHLRNLVETGSIQSIEPVNIAVPKSKCKEQVRQIELLDLPGIESAELKEQRHVARCVEFWVPNSHICLIVNGAADLTFLRDIPMSNLQRWYKLPDNYFIVLTRAFSPESVQRRIQSNEIVETKDVISYYRREIEDILKEKIGTIYPIEIGGSIKFLSEKEQILANSIFSALKERIEKLDIQDISFRFLTGYYQEIVVQSEREIKYHKDQIAAKQEELDQIQKQKERFQHETSKMIDDYTYRLSILNKRINRADFIYYNTFKSDCFEEKALSIYDHVSEEGMLVWKASKLNHLASNTVLTIQDDMILHLNEMNNLFNEINDAFELYGNDVLRMETEPHIAFYNWDYSIMDQYFSKGSFKAKKEEMLELLLDDITAACRSVGENYQNIKNRCHSLKSNVLFSKKRLENVYKVKVDKTNKHYQQIYEHRESLKDSLEQIIEQWKQDLDHASKYRNYIIKHFLQQKNYLLRMAESDNLEERYLAGLHLYTLGKDASKIIHTLEFENEQIL
ncbi:hypothetical protein GKZ89_14090 [Bacillus mangrovi]|uniref:Uncharacterized protein n=1 Tax=Metabacillus mangrovi TaxID=1491830 RepID=A0A7X2S837_9BACI|nr:hypothetical protein [Metabacillus mangrovi]MTH54531.1 hypothetical protein [Metabacillus mangrovi]